MDIVWVLMAAGMAISFVNGLAVFSTDYMTVPADATFEITDINGTLANTTQDESSLTTTSIFAVLGIVKDIATNMFYVYGSMVHVWHIPTLIATILQVIVVMAWLMFFLQLIGRFPWGGMEN